MNGLANHKRIALNHAAAGSAGGRLTRREFLRICAKAGLGFGLCCAGASLRPVFAAPTQAQILNTVGPQSAIEPHSDQQRFLRSMRQRFNGTTLRIIQASKASGPHLTIWQPKLELQPNQSNDGQS